MILSPTSGGFKDFTFPLEDGIDDHHPHSIPYDVFESVVGALKARHRAERDSLMVEVQVFKAVLEGMASKIRYLQEYKLDREQMQIQLFKYRHLNEKLKKENAGLSAEVRLLNKKVENIKKVMLEFDHEYLAHKSEENDLLE